MIYKNMGSIMNSIRYFSDLDSVVSQHNCSRSIVIALQKPLIILGLLLVSLFAQSQESGIIVSSIGAQEVYAKARITVYFSTLKHFDTVELASNNLPAFGMLINDGNGSGRMIFDPDSSDIGMYTIALNIASGSLSSTSTFDLEVKSIPGDAMVYYVDPVNGAVDNPGTEEMPFSTMATVLINNLDLINANTFFFLRSGYHGNPVFQGSYDSPVYVLAERMHNPAVKKLNFSFTNNWYVSGMAVSPESINLMDNASLVNVFSGSKNIVLTNCKIYSIDDATVWTTNEDWYDYCGNGIICSGTDCLFKNNYLKNTWFSVELRNPSSEFSYNIINWFGADAIRAIADHQRIKYNQIKNATVFDYYHPTRPQHDDGIQSWTFNKPVVDMQIIGNQIADIADPNLPLPTEIMQGIVDFDGFAEDWVVENNLVITHHAHGIALYGAKNCKVTNNTVIKNPFNRYSTSSQPWIRINPRKVTAGGDLSTGNLIRNNIMATYQDENKEPGSQDHNTMGANYNSFFEDYKGWNFYLSKDSPALNSGSTEDAPFTDMAQKARNVGGIDAGCFERGASLSDRENPTTPSNILATQVTESSMTLEWDASQDNTGVLHYEVIVDGKSSLYSSGPSMYITGLKPAREYQFAIKAVDHFDNSSAFVMHTESTIEAPAMVVHFIAADRHDQVIKSDQKLMWVGMPYNRVGGYFGSEDASLVLPFKLPCIDQNERVVSADLSVGLNDIVNSPGGEVDVYGLEYRMTSDILASDHWQGPFGDSPNGVPISEGYITPQTANGSISLRDPEKLVLAQYVQDQYDAGAGCLDFAFLRLNGSQSTEADNAYYEIYSANNLNNNQAPLLKIVTSGPSSVEAIEITDGATVSPNPGSGNDITVRIKGFSHEDIYIVIHDSKGMEVYRSHVLNTSNKQSIHLNPGLSTGLYYVTVLGESHFAQTTLIVI